MALGTGRRLGAFGGAGAAARFARFLTRNLDRRFDLFRRFGKRDLEVVAQVGTAPRPAPATAAATEDVGEAEDVAEPAEDVLEAGEDVGIEAAGRGAAKTGVAEAVVHVALVAVGEHRVRLCRFLELVFGSAIPGIAIGVIGERQLAIGALDFLLGRRLGDAEHFVVVAFAHGRLATFTIDARSRRSPSR